MNEENYKNLKKYYKNVLTCSGCRKEFGSDSKRVKGLCPICSGVLGKNWNTNHGTEEVEVKTHDGS